MPSEISSAVPPQCSVTFAQVLSRHGARHPTARKSTSYHATIDKIHRDAESYAPDYAFIKKYRYSLGADRLTHFGKREMFDSGMHFYYRYPELAAASTPFIRASGRERVVQSARKWAKGFHQAKRHDGHSDSNYNHSIVVIDEDYGSNNTLHHGLCTAFENNRWKMISSARAQWAAIFVPPIQSRLNANLPGAHLTITDTINIMDLCPFGTIASKHGILSPFCDLFSVIEWEQYNYYHSLSKYYGFGAGSPLGPTQGVGYANELISRLIGEPVVDETSTNQTLDKASATFPLGRTLYADFGHDSVMTSVLFALGLYDSTEPLSNTTLQTPDDVHGYSAAYTVPFAARVYFEKLRCSHYPDEEMVRIIVNDRVIPLDSCGGDSLGRCSLSKFVKSLTLASQGGHWNQCFTEHRSHRGTFKPDASQKAMGL